MASFKFKNVIVDVTMSAPNKESQYYTNVQFQVLLNQLITNRTYIKHRTTAVGNFLYHEILVKPEAVQ
jgi:hypothetical protein